MKEEIDWKKEILECGHFNNKFERNLNTQFSNQHASEIMSLFEDDERLFNLPVSEFVDFFVKN